MWEGKASISGTGVGLTITAKEKYMVTMIWKRGAVQLERKKTQGSLDGESARSRERTICEESL